MLLLKSYTANATSQYCEIGDANYFNVMAVGNVGGGSLAFEVSPDAGTTWVAYEPSGTALALAATLAGASDADLRVLEGLHGMRFRATLSGSTTPTVKLYVGGPHVSIPSGQT